MFTCKTPGRSLQQFEKSHRIKQVLQQQFAEYCSKVELKKMFKKLFKILNFKKLFYLVKGPIKSTREIFKNLF